MKRGLAVFALLASLLLACSLTAGSSPTATAAPAPPVDPTPGLATPAVQLPPGGPAAWLTYINNAYGFLLQYPAGGAGLISGATDTMARIQLPINQGTNLAEKYVDVAVQLGPAICQSPEAAGFAPGSLSPTNQSLAGLNWVQESFSQGAAGSEYQSSAYSTTSGNVCVSLTFVLHSHNPGAFSTPPPVFDQAQESAVFSQIVATFRWLNGTGAATPTQTPWATSVPTLVPPTGTAVPTPTPKLILKFPIPILPIFHSTPTPTNPPLG